MTTPRQPADAGRRIATNAALNTAGLIAPLVVAFITLPIIIDGLGNAAFGVLAIVWMVLTYLTELGFGSTTTRYAAEAIGAGRAREVGAIAWTTAGLQTLIAAGEGLVLAALTPWLVGSVLDISAELEPAARSCLYLLALSIPLTGFGKAFRGLLEAAHRFDLALIVHVPLTTAGYILAAVGAQLGWPLPAVFGVIVAARIATFPAYLLAARRALPGYDLGPRRLRRRMRDLVGFAGWASVSTIVSPLLVYLDRFMVGSLLSMTAVAFYAAPYELVARLALIPGGLVGALFPMFSRLSGDPDRRDQAEVLAARSVNLLLVLFVPVAVLLVGGARDGLALWLGPDFAAESTLAFRILVVGVVANAVAHVPFGLLQGIGRPDIPARFHLLELPLQIGVAWLLVSRWGIAGAALAWTFRMCLDAALLFRASARLGALRSVAFLNTRIRATLGVGAIGTVVALGSASAVAQPIVRGGIILCVAALTAAMTWHYGTAAADRESVRALLRRGRAHA